MKHLRSVISAYVTLKKFTPGLQKIYTDKSTISATFSNSGVRKIFNNGSLGVLKLWIQRRIDVNFTLNIGQSQITCKLDPNK